MYELNKYIAIKEIPDASVDLIHIDPPYFYQSGAQNPTLIPNKVITRIDKCKTAYIKELNNYNLTCDFDYKLMIPEMIRICKKINILIWCSRFQINNMINTFNSSTEKKLIFDLLVWCKKNPIPAANNSFLSDLEYCLYFRESGVKLNEGYEIKSKFYASYTNKSDKEDFGHPTIKPLPFVSRLIAHCSNVNDVVVDFFIGSGTTAVAAKELNRRYLGFEINPTFHKIAVDRLNGINSHGQTSIFTNFDLLESEALK